MKTKLMALMLMAGGTLFAGTHVAIGVRIGGPVVVPAPVAVNVYRPPCPGPGYVWIDGYYDQFGNWYAGYWALPPYAGAYWMAPRFNGGRFYAGYWTGPRGVYRPEPRYERGHERGFERNERGNGHGRGGEFREGFRH